MNLSQKIKISNITLISDTMDPEDDNIFHEV